MTFSDAWLESPEDQEFEYFLQQTPRLRVLPHVRNGYWINHLKEWAEKEGLPIQYPDHLEIRVVVCRDSLRRFMDDMFGTTVPRSILHDYITQHCKENVSYVIVADEL